ncbi:MAG: hypothetical protein ACRELG_00275 [Gemmataceae bacterium]
MSRRFKGRHGKVQANPKARPAPPVTLDDSNSFVDPTQPDCRKPKVLNSRAFVRAESTPPAKKQATAE